MTRREDLIIDRSYADLSFALALKAANLPYPLEESLRFSYDWRTFQRVEEYIQFLVEYLRDYGYDVPITVKTWWNENSLVTHEDGKRYLQNIETIKETLGGIDRTLPKSINRLTLESANAIEKFLFDLEPLLHRRSLSFRHFGSSYFGQTLKLPNIGTGEV